MPERMKLLGNTKSKMAMNEHVENVSHLKITEVVLFHCSVVNNNYRQDSWDLFKFVYFN